MKKVLFLLLVMIISIAGLDQPVVATDYISVVVLGETVEFDQPPMIIDGRTLVPIRGVCEKVGATVVWNSSTKEVVISKDDIRLGLTIGRKYMQMSEDSAMYLDVPPQIFGGRTLLPIRAVMEVLGYEVLWNSSSNTIVIEEAGLNVPSITRTQMYAPPNWASISTVQQFEYMNEGMGYAYIEDNTLKITTPSKKINIDMKYPKLGDVISDDGGNFYIVWGKDNETADASVMTVFISKYSPQGEHIMTTGFVGKSSPWGDADIAKTLSPFSYGNCVSVIANGVLVNYHGKTRYDGHQSDSVIAVTISDMNPYQLPNDTFSGHSFNQSLIYCEITSDFLFASQGDAYIRGFRVNDRYGKYGDEKENIFHFYLEENANHDMWIVNKTFAQLGNIVETSEGVAIVGASVKSISEEAKNEKQNLFVQIFNPRVEVISPAMFIGGTERSGATSFDINDNNNTPLTNVTDYGVHWLTDYTDTDVIAPQVVAVNDKIVILWSTNDDTFYMVLSASGEVITPATTLGGVMLNSYERPIYYNGAIYWVSVLNNLLKVRSLEIK